MYAQKRIYRLKPIVRNCSWGGKTLATQLNIRTELPCPGEIVAAGGFGSRDSEVEGLGIKLSQLYSEAPDLFGTNGGIFPLTVNLIDAAAPLSVQVHPDDGYAEKNGDKSGLAEAWIVLGCERSSRILAGHTAQTQQDFQNRADAGEWDKLFRYIDAEKGAFFYLPPGTVHSIGAGVQIYEVTHASDVVYRLYDYEREDNSRPLDISKAAEVVYSPQLVSVQPPKLVRKYPNISETLYIDTPFVIRRLDIYGSARWHQDGFGVLTVIEGLGNINGDSLEAGNSILIPRGYGELSFTGAFTAMLSSYRG